MLMLMSPESRVPAAHPIRRIKALSDDALARLSPVFDAMYSSTGRPSIPPERLLKATLLMALYSVRSERQFCEQLDYNLLFRWFLDMDMTEASFDATAFTHNRARLIAHDVAGEFFRAVVDQAKAANLMSSDHFTVDGTLIEAAASLKSFKRKDDDDTTPPDDQGNPTVDFHGEKRSNETHESTTDPDAKLARKGKGKEAKLSYSAHALMENRNGLLVGFELDTADGYAEPPSSSSTTACRASAASPSARTRVTTRATSSPRAAIATSRRMSRRRRGIRRSMRERRSQAATRLVSASGSASRRSSGG